MENRTAFFYGSLMVPEILYRVIYRTSYPSREKKDSLEIRPAILHDYCRHRVKDASYPAIIESAGDTVRGTLVTGLSNVAVERLDRFEGRQYYRGTVRVKVLAHAGDDVGRGNVEGDEVEAETYIWRVDPNELDYREWDFAEFKRNKMRAWIDPPPPGTVSEETNGEPERETSDDLFDDVTTEEEDDEASESEADSEDEVASEKDTGLEDDVASESDADVASESGVTYEDDAPDEESSEGAGDDAPSRGAAASRRKV